MLRTNQRFPLSIAAADAAAAAAVAATTLTHHPPRPLSFSPPSTSLSQRSSFIMAALPEIKLFGKWSYEDVEVRLH